MMSAVARQFLRQILPLLIACGTLASCHYTDSQGMPVELYESAEGEAVVRQLLKELPDPNPGVPKSHAIVLGELGARGDYKAASVAFIKRFADTGLRIISADVLSPNGPDATIVDPEQHVAAYVLQIRLMKQIDANTWDVETGWSYKKLFERRRYRVEQKDGKPVATFVEHIDGNWPPAK
jgi:hypothetical protein